MISTNFVISLKKTLEVTNSLQQLHLMLVAKYSTLLALIHSTMALLATL